MTHSERLRAAKARAVRRLLFWLVVCVVLRLVIHYLLELLESPWNR